LSDFVEQEFASLNLGDERRNRRLREVLRAFMASPLRSIQAACSGWAETMGAYRVLNSSKTTFASVLAPHREATAARVREYDCVALIQDTSELDFSKKTRLEGTGPLDAANRPRRGFFLHAQFAVTEDRLPLGVYHAHIHAREDRKEGEKKVNNHCLPIEEKESYRWLEGYRQACELATATGGETEIFSISDREGDIYEIFEQRERFLQQANPIPPAHWIVRVAKNRTLLEPDGKSEGEENAKLIESSIPLFDQVRDGKLMGEVQFDVKHRTARGAGTGRKTLRKSREVRQEIRVTEVTPRVPRRIGGKKLLGVSYWVIEAREIDPPEGEEPIHWVIATSLPVTDFAAACRVLNLYLARWDIEVFFRVLKTGCRIEEIQLKTAEALYPCLALYLIVAWRILYLTHLSRECPDLPCSVVFDEVEWKAAIAVAKKKKIKVAERIGDREPMLNEMVAMVGAFGGHLGRKNDGPPGPQSMWQGLMRVRDFAIAWEAFFDKAE
jgi:hypothetical protein